MHLQTYNPTVLEQRAFTWQLASPVVHSSTSVSWGKKPLETRTWKHFLNALDKREMFGDQTPSNIVWWPNILAFGHLVWCCLIVFDCVWLWLVVFGCVWSCLVVWKAIKHSIKNLKHCFCSRVRLDSRVSNLFDAGMRATLAQRLVSIVWSVFDQTCFNRLATHFNINMFGHQTMLDGVLSPNISRLSSA